MAVTRLPRTLADLAVFTRPTTADYTDAQGDTQTAEVDEPRFEFIQGEAQGLKFGDGDKLVVPFSGWFNSEQGIGVIRAYTPVKGEVVARAGDWEAEGVDGWKTFVHKWNNEPDNLGTGIEVFPAAPNDGVTRYCAGLLNYVLNIEVEDAEIMLGFNAVINEGGW